MGNDPVNNVDPDGGSIGGWIRPFLQTLNLVRPATPAIGQFSGVAQPTSLSGSTAAGTSGGVSTSGGLLNSLGNAAASALGQWVANKLLPMPQGPDAGQLQTNSISQLHNTQFNIVQCNYEYHQQETDAKSDIIRSRYKKMIVKARSYGLNFAADNLQYFIDGNGGSKKVSLVTLEENHTFVSAVEENQERFNKQIKDMADVIEDG